MDNSHHSLDFIPAISRNALQQFLDQHNSGIIFTATDGKILFANDKLAKIFECPTKEIKGKQVTELLQIENHNHPLYEHLNSPLPIVAGMHLETTINRESGAHIPLSVSCNLVRDDGETLIFLVVDDISQQLSLQQQLYQQTVTDPLTGIFNRRHFDEQLTKEFKRSSRYRRPFSVIIIDIDGFKQANDLHGHSYGDDMLITATESFQRVLRQGDTVYRYGGDEFAMILPETSKEGAIEVTERLKETFAKQCNDKERRIKLSLSIGIANSPEDGIDEKSLIGAADRRMYISKESGGNMITAYDSIHFLNSDTEAVLRSLSNLAHMIETRRGLSASGVSHSQSIRSLAIEVGYKLGLSRERMALLEQAAMLHDIGMLYISNTILNKEDSLGECEWKEVKRHPLIGEEIIGMISPSELPELRKLQQIVAQHHEHLDGSGYPRGLSGDEIIMEARILIVVDAYNAMVAKRPYRPALSKQDALAEIESGIGTHYDPAVVEKLLELERDDIDTALT